MPRPTKLTREQEVEIGRRYRKGESQKALAAEYRLADGRIPAILNRLGVPVRSLSEAVRQGHAANNPGPVRLLQLYDGADQPSLSALASALGVSVPSVRAWLKAAGRTPRSCGEQTKIELAKGRTLPGSAYLSAAQRTHAGHCGARAVTPEGRACSLAGLHSPASQAKRAATQRRQIVRPCAWCGAPVSRQRSAGQLYAHSTCDRAHGSAWVNHQRFRPNAPRALILQQITEAIAQHRSEGGEVHRTLPAKFGAPLGATDVEYDAWWSALDLGSLNDYEMTAYLDWDLDRKIREAGLQSGVSED